MSPPLPSRSARELLCCCGLSAGSGETATWEPLEAATTTIPESVVATIPDLVSDSGDSGMDGKGL